MSAVVIAPGSPEHMRLITPSKVSAILGVSRFTSPYRMWHQMKGLIDPEPHKDIFAVGHAFEHALAALWKSENPGWQLSPDEVQIVREDLGFPALVTLDRRARRGKARRVVEFKIARSLDDWGDDFTDAAPADYVAQVTAQMMFTGYTRHAAHLMVMGPFFKHHTYVIEYDAGIADVILTRCQQFYDSLQADEPPPLDDSIATYSCVRELHPDIEAGAEVQLDPSLAAEFVTAIADQKDAERNLRGIKTQVLDAMGVSEFARVSDLIVAKRAPHASGSVALNIGRGLSTDAIIAAAGGAL